MDPDARLREVVATAMLADRFAGLRAVGAGLILIVLAILVLATAHDRHLFIVGLTGIGAGVTLVALGLGSKFGTQARLEAALRDDSRESTPTSSDRKT